MPFAATWMGLEIIVLSEASQTEKEKYHMISPICRIFKNDTNGGFPGGAVVENPPANAGDTGSSPGPGRSHMPQKS